MKDGYVIIVVIGKIGAVDFILRSKPMKIRVSEIVCFSSGLFAVILAVLVIIELIWEVFNV